MRIALDARLNAYRRGGIPQYTRQLLTALADIAPDDRLISLQHHEMQRQLVVAPNVERRTIWTPPHHRFERWSLPMELLPLRADVLHFPDFIAPRLRPCPAVVTIHDLAFLRYPEILDDSARSFYSQVRASALRAQGIIAVSEATRQDIVQMLDIPPEDVTVIYEAAAPLYRRLDLRPGEVRLLNGQAIAEGAFLLFVSTLEPRKNLPTLLRALRLCIDRRPDIPYRLVVVGARGWRDEPIFQTARDLKLDDYVLFAGSVGQYDLRWLYNACRIYINPSLYEGFGLPLLEAMACGAPCIAAATSSLPEIGGDAVLYVPPSEVELWADTIGELWDDQERRSELGRLGRVRAQRFSWIHAARETRALYQRASERGAWRPVRPHPPARTAPPPPAEAAAEWPHTCRRCGAPMQPGTLQPVGNTAQTDPHPGGTRGMRTWVCMQCGYAELQPEPVGGDTRREQPRPLVLPVDNARTVQDTHMDLP